MESSEQERQLILPTGKVAFDLQLRILRTYAIKSKHNKVEVYYKDVAKACEASSTTVSAVHGFFESLGLLISKRKGYFKVSQAVLDFDTKMGWDDKEGAGQVLKPLFEKSRLFELIQDKLRIESKIKYQDLVEYLGIEVAIRKSLQIVVQAAIEWLLFVDLILKDKQTNIITLSMSGVHKHEVEPQIETPAIGTHPASEEQVFELSETKRKQLLKMAVQGPAWDRVPTNVEGLYIVNPQKDEQERRVNPRLQLEITDGARRTGYYLRTKDDLKFLKRVVNDSKTDALVGIIEELFYKEKARKLKRFEI